MAEDTIEVELTPEQIKAQKIETLWKSLEERAVELSTSKNRTIVPLSIDGDNEGDFVTGYMYEIDGLTDAKLAGAVLAGWETCFPKAIQALESLILFDESDPRFRQRKYMNGAAVKLLSLVEIGTPTAKKK